VHEHVVDAYAHQQALNNLEAQERQQAEEERQQEALLKAQKEDRERQDQRQK